MTEKCFFWREKNKPSSAAKYCRPATWCTYKWQTWYIGYLPAVVNFVGCCRCFNVYVCACIIHHQLCALLLIVVLFLIWSLLEKEARKQPVLAWDFFFVLFCYSTPHKQFMFWSHFIYQRLRSHPMLMVATFLGWKGSTFWMHMESMGWLCVYKCTEIWRFRGSVFTVNVWLCIECLHCMNCSQIGCSTLYQASVVFKGQ